MSKNETVCVTTFRQGALTNRIESKRCEVFLETVQRLHSSKIPLLAVYTDTQRQTLKTLKSQRVTLVRQRSKGMGRVRREAMRAASTYFPEARFFCWLEPEKPNLVQFVHPMTQWVVEKQAALGIFNRKEMTSYPPEQAYYYLFCRSVASQLLGFDIDYSFGPMLIPRSSLSYFLNYRSKYGDKWDSILVPRLRIIKEGLRTAILPVYFRNDKRMTDVELGNTEMILKRLEQFNNVIPSLIAEWQELGLANK